MIASPTAALDQMNIVVIGHVDHGKSTVIGRLLADTHSLPEGKLENVRAQCRRNARPFEYAFLLDALKDEQSQGITIDSARCFFKSARRQYIIIDAPGHIEFLKNMVSGAARAEAALLVIDANEGVKENSRRHGYLLSMLGIRQVAVLVNKMDLVGYRQVAFEAIRREYAQFLERVGIVPAAYIPIAAREGDNMMHSSRQMPWHSGPAVLELMDSFSKEVAPLDKPLRLPVQDVYKFTEDNDDRRIIVGRVETGSLKIGDDVIFLPTGKRSQVASIEYFNGPLPTQATAGQSTGITLRQQIYIKPGEILCRADQTPASVSTRLRINLFWLARQPMVMGKRYKMKLAGARVAAWLTEITRVMDASSLSATESQKQIERHDVAECVLETLKPIACDPAESIPQTGRFVIIDNYEIAGGGVVLDAAEATGTLVEENVRRREQAWERTSITPEMRAARYDQRSTLLLLCGNDTASMERLARTTEAYLFERGRLAYYLGLRNSLLGVNADLGPGGIDELRDEYLRRLGETAHLFTHAGLILITTVRDLDDDELEVLQTLNRPGETLVVSVGESTLTRRSPDLALAADEEPSAGLRRIHELLQSRKFLPDYVI